MTLKDVFFICPMAIGLMAVQTAATLLKVALAAAGGFNENQTQH